MEALVCKKLGDPKSNEAGTIELIKDEAIPQLNSATSVRVRVRATRLNYANYLQILGKYQEKAPLPFIPGSDYAGVIKSVGPKVSRFKVGDHVCSFAGLGTFSEFVVADESDLFGVLPGCDLVDVAALLMAFGTSHVAFVHRDQLSFGQVLLVLGAAGGVGLAAVQIGKVCGAVVIVVSRFLGLPSIVVLIRDLQTEMKRKNESKNMCISCLVSLFPEDCKFYPADTKEELHKFMWLFGEQRLTTPGWRNQRPYLVAQKVQMEATDGNA